MTFILLTPFTGLGLYNGFRGNRWLRNRITIFKQFVIPSLLNQSDRNFIHWISWRPEERSNSHVKELERYLSQIPNYRFVFTFGGLPIWDDKYKDGEAWDRMFKGLFNSLPTLFDYCPDEEVCLLLQPSDDLYHKDTVSDIRAIFMRGDIQAVSHKYGYMCNYVTKDVREYNPTTNPPFHAIKYPKEVFFDVRKHMEYISLKKDVGQYKKGTPQPSHEYLPDCVKTVWLERRGFLVGCHGENISTHFNNPFGGEGVDKSVLDDFGIMDAPPAKIPRSFRKWLIRKLPHRWQKKIRYWWGEKLYNWIRS